MTRLVWTVAAVLIGALLTGCASPAVPEVRDQTAGGVNTPLPATLADANSASTSSDALPSYEPVANLSGEIISIGGSTTTNVVARVAVLFRQVYPNVTLRISSSQTNIGPEALLKGLADIVPMSRTLTPEEIRAFQDEYGYAPTEIKVAADALAIFVEKTNPVPGLTLEQLDGIFSRTQRRGGPSIETWGQAGLTDEWTDLPITLYGFHPGDGAYRVFQQQVLKGGAFRLTLRVEAGGSSIVQGAAAVPGAVGCASIFFACQRVRAVPIAGADGRFYSPTEENVHGHRYPLSRFLYVCVNKPPRQPLPGPAAEFLRFLLSREGQRIVAEGGNIPLDTATVKECIRRLAD